MPGSQAFGRIAHLNPENGDIENLEVPFFSTRLLRQELAATVDRRLNTPTKAGFPNVRSELPQGAADRQG